MCGIIGVFNFSDAKQTILNGMQTIQNRGKDGYGIATEHGNRVASKLEEFSTKPGVKTTNAVGHCLHRVVSTVPQPLAGKGRLVANCEIYNWKQIATKEKIICRNDAELLFKLLEKTPGAKIPRRLKKLDGDFAFAYWRNQTVWVGRDVIGIKPVWFSLENNRFGFASEAKALYAMGFTQATELNPRKTLVFNARTKKVRFLSQPFFLFQTKKRKETFNPHKFETMLLRAVQKRIPKQKFGILFSGGIDSLVLAKACQKLGHQPLLLVAGIALPDGKEPADVVHARKAAAELGGPPLREITVSALRAQNQLAPVVSLIESSDPVKTGIALPLFFACERARAEGCKVLFTGLGADGLLGGFARQQNAQNPNRDCRSYVLKAFETDLYRDDVIAMQNSVELRVPYYDLEFVKTALQIPATEKIVHGVNKKPLRDLAVHWGIKSQFALQPKKAMQYGSNADKLIEKLAKKQHQTKGLFLQQFLQKPNQRLGALISGGKDGWYAARIQHQKNYEIACLIAIQSKNPDSFMFHTPNIKWVDLQSKASAIPLVWGKTTGKKETELKDLKKTIQTAQQKFKLDGIIVGALLSNYQRERVEKICDALGLKLFAPLWQKNQALELEELLQNKFQIVFSSIAAYGLNENWLGKPLDQQRIVELKKLHEKFGLNPAGEGGEFETFVLDCPLFRKKIVVEKAKKTMQNEHAGIWKIKRAALQAKK